MFGFSGFSTAPISALPNELLALFSVAFVGKGTITPSLYDPYAAFVRNPPTRRIYTIELSVRAIP